MVSGFWENAVEKTEKMLGVLRYGRSLIALGRLQEQRVATRGFCVNTDRSLYDRGELVGTNCRRVTHCLAAGRPALKQTSLSGVPLTTNTVHCRFIH